MTPKAVNNYFMSLYQHPLFTIDLNKVIAVYQNEDEVTVTIQTDDQRKIEVATESAGAAVDLLGDIATQWESSVGPLLRHANYVFLTSAIYSIQVDAADVYINFRDQSVSFTLATEEDALAVLAELTRQWQTAIATEPAPGV
jgi:hypothetical protein